MAATTTAPACCLLTILVAAAAGAEPRDVGPLVMDGIPDIPAATRERMRQYLSSREAVFMDWTPGGGMLISTRFGDTPQIHLVREPMGVRTQLTFFAEPISFARHSPNSRVDGFVFFKDVGGDENYQLYYFDKASGNYELLTDGESRNGFAVWSNSGRQLAYYSNQRNGTNWDIYVTRPGRRSQLVVKSSAGAWLPLDWAPGDRELLVWQYVSINESALYTAHLIDGDIKAVGRDPALVGINAAAYSRDGRGVFVASDADSEFRQLRYVGLRGRRERVLSGAEPWDVEELDPSADGRYLAYTVNVDGISRLHLLDLREERELSLPELPAGPINNLRFDAAGVRIAMTIETASSPRDVYVFDLRDDSLTRWTESEVGGVPSEAFVTPALQHYPTFDAVEGRPRQVPAFVYRPRGKGPFPVLIHLHGGPESQFRPGFEPVFQYFVHELGFAVVAPNVRGSSGYGRSYLQLDNGRLREDAVRDVGRLLDWIETEPDLDASRVVVSGASYGGYLTLATLAAYGERLLGGIDTVGISNFVTFLENTSEYRRDLRRQEYGDERDAEMRAYLREISPVTRAEAIRKPLLVVQGLNDPRVPASESEQMVETIRARGGTVWYLMARDEGHGFRKKSNREVYYATIATFLQQLLAQR